MTDRYRNILQVMTRFLMDEDGATAIEYALIASLFVIAIMATVRLLGESVLDLYETVQHGFS